MLMEQALRWVPTPHCPVGSSGAAALPLPVQRSGQGCGVVEPELPGAFLAGSPLTSVVSSTWDCGLKQLR